MEVCVILLKLEFVPYIMRILWGQNVLTISDIDSTIFMPGVIDTLNFLKCK